MIKLDITENSFLAEDAEIADDWMNDNIGELLGGRGLMSYGKGWKITKEFKPDLPFGGTRWYVEFENENHAIWFLMRWS